MCSTSISHPVVRGIAVIATGAVLATIYPEEKSNIALAVFVTLGASFIQSQLQFKKRDSQDQYAGFSFLPQPPPVPPGDGAAIVPSVKLKFSPATAEVAEPSVESSRSVSQALKIDAITRRTSSFTSLEMRISNLATRTISRLGATFSRLRSLT